MNDPEPEDAEGEFSLPSSLQLKLHFRYRPQATSQQRKAGSLDRFVTVNMTKADSRILANCQ